MTVRKVDELEFQRMLARAHARVTGDHDEVTLLDAWHRPASRARRGVSRQARHARAARAKKTAILSSLILAADEPDYERLLRDPRFGRLRPYAADKHAEIYHLASLDGVISNERLHRLWEIGRDRLLQLGPRARLLDSDRLLELQTALAALYCAPVFLGAQMADEWHSLWREARRRGVLKNPHLQMQLLVVGVYVGCGQAYTDFLMRGDRRVDAADMMCFVRRDESEQLVETRCALLRGDLLDPAECLFPSSPVSTLKHLARYIRMCMRSPLHFDDEPRVMLVLAFVDYLLAHLPHVAQQPWLARDLSGLLCELGRIEQVQQLEKSRFWRVYERMPAGPGRQFVREVWSRAYTELPGD